MTNILLILFSPFQMELAGGKKTNLVRARETKTGPEECLRLQDWSVSAPCPCLLSYRMEGGKKIVWVVCLKTHKADPTVHRWFAISQQKHYLPTQSENLPLSLSCVDEATRKGLRERSRPHFSWNEWATRSSVLKSSSFRDKGCL